MINRVSSALMQLAIFSAALLVAGYLYKINLSSVREDAALLLKDRAMAVEQNVELARALVDHMRGQMTENLKRVAASGDLHPALKQLKDYKGDRYVADGIQADDALGYEINGSMSGIGSVNELSRELKQELSAAFGLSMSLGAVVRNDPNYVWSYYTSANQFMYIAPKVGADDFTFSKDLYKKEFWVPAAPSQNPKRNIVISDLYNDEAGQGYMISISAPVYVGDVFRGVVSLDLGLSNLQSLLMLEGSASELHLIDEKGEIVASQRNFKPGDFYRGFEDILAGKGRVVSFDGRESISAVVVPGELYLIHSVKNTLVVLEVLKRMLVPALILLMFVSLLLLSIKLRVALKRVTGLATRDGLTNLLNRRAVVERCQEIFEFSDRYTDCVSLIMMDIDKFKDINDRFGHGVGDDAIRMVAQELVKNTRRTDCLARIGGEEFLIVMPATQGANALQIAEKLRQTIGASHFSQQQLRLTVSAGCVERRDGESYDAAMKRADDLLYQAKRNGRNRVEFESSCSHAAAQAEGAEPRAGGLGQSTT